MSLTSPKYVVGPFTARDAFKFGAFLIFSGVSSLAMVVNLVATILWGKEWAPYVTSMFAFVALAVVAIVFGTFLMRRAMKN